MPRGGKRSGTPGVAYANRTDLNQGPRVPTGQTYGKATEQRAMQQVAPLPMDQPSMRIPPPVDRPSARPGEPVTAGVPVGPGPGPQALMPMPGADWKMQLAAAYQMLPDESLREFLEEVQSGAYDT